MPAVQFGDVGKELEFAVDQPGLGLFADGLGLFIAGNEIIDQFGGGGVVGDHDEDRRASDLGGIPFVIGAFVMAIQRLKPATQKVRQVFGIKVGIALATLLGQRVLREIGV